MSFVRALLMAALAAGLSLPAAAQELRIGLKSEPTSLDPQHYDTAANNQVALHIFDPLVARDDRQRPIPALAMSWQAVSDTVWEFKLRPNVTFHDGTPFTAEDVVFTFDRAAKVPNSPGSFTWITRRMTRIEIVDPLTVRLHTNDTWPLLLAELANLPILSRKAMAGGAPEGKTTAELDRGEGLVGTGPFRFVQWQRGGDLVLMRNEAYWGGRPAWAKVTLKPLGNDARVAALTSGDVDLIEDPPLAELPRLRKDEKLSVAEAASSRVVYLALDTFAEPSPGIPDAAGKNPLKDRRVRQALSLAIDRKALVDQILEGGAVPAGDLLPPTAFGTRKEAQADKLDLTTARRLLAEAGYARSGFSINLGTPNGRYPSDFKVAQAIAASWKELGLRIEIEAPAPPVFFKNRDEHKYSAYLSGWLAESGELSHPLRGLAATPNREKRMGGGNRGRYSNPEMDTKLDEALRTLDDRKREALLQDAGNLLAADYGLLPLFFELSVWAMRRDLAYVPRADQATLAQHVTLK